MKNYTVYMHISPSEKVYIGITRRNPIKRWGNGKGYLNNDYFMKAIYKYGWNNFKHEILYTNLSKQEAEEKEIELINYYKSNHRTFGYNIQNGGSSIGKHSEETKIKIGKANKGRKPWSYKNHLSEETRKKISDYHKGTHLSEETKIKISKTHKGKKQSYEAIRKRAESCMKPVLCIELNKVFKSIKSASEYTNVSTASIGACLKGKTKRSAGYHWQYYK